MPHRNSLDVNALWVTGSGGGSVVMSKQGLDDMDEMDLSLAEIGVLGVKRLWKSFL